MIFTDTNKVVNCLPPIDLNGSAKTGDVVSLKNYDHATFIVTSGATAAASTITLKKCTSVAAANATLMTFNYRKEITTTGDTLEALTAATTSGFATTNIAATTYVIEVDTAELAPVSTVAATNFDCLQILFSDPSAGSMCSCVCILSKGRYQDRAQPTAILD